MERSHNIRSWHLGIFTAGFVEVDPELNTNQVHYIRLRLLNRQKEHVHVADNVLTKRYTSKADHPVRSNLTGDSFFV